MKFLILGAGGVGGYFGARLAADGNDVTFVARGAHRGAMAQRGLKILSDRGDLTIETPQLHQDPDSTGLCDIILVCVKLWDTEAAADFVKPLLAHDTAVVSLQNGVSAEDTLAGVLGPQHILGGVARIAAAIKEPGVIEHTRKLAKIQFGELDGAKTWRQDCLLSACIGAGIEAEVLPDVTTEIWKKFAILAPLAGAACMYRSSIGELLAEAERRRLLEELIAETVAVARARGADLPPDFTAEAIRAYGAFPDGMKPSMLNDLEAGRRLELAWLNGEVVRLAKDLGVDTPANARVTETLAPFAMGEGS